MICTMLGIQSAARSRLFIAEDTSIQLLGALVVEVSWRWAVLDPCAEPGLFATALELVGRPVDTC